MAKRVKLNKIAAAWVRALRSGKYKQGRTLLGRVNPDTGELVCNCVFGVLCELAVKAGYINSMVRMGREEIFYDDRWSAVPIPHVSQWAGLKTQWGKWGDGSGENLATANDSGKSFKQIARIIEQKAKELFV